MHSGLVVNEAIESGFHVRNRGAKPGDISAMSWPVEGQETDEGEKKDGWVEKA